MRADLRVAVPEDPLGRYGAALDQAGQVEVVSLLQVDVGAAQNFSNWL